MHGLSVFIDLAGFERYGIATQPTLGNEFL